MSAPEAVVVLFTAATPEDVARIGKALVGEGLAACVNVVPGIRSIYRWEGKVRDEPEALGIAKARRDAVERLVARLKALHAYKVPEILALPILAGNPDYLAWVAGNGS